MSSVEYLDTISDTTSASGTPAMCRPAGQQRRPAMGQKRSTVQSLRDSGNRSLDSLSLSSSGGRSSSVLSSETHGSSDCNDVRHKL